jgi:hypothetical protein
LYFFISAHHVSEWRAAINAVGNLTQKRVVPAIWKSAAVTSAVLRERKYLTAATNGATLTPNISGQLQCAVELRALRTRTLCSKRNPSWSGDENSENLTRWQQGGG